MSDETEPLSLPPVLQFEPPKPVYRLRIEEDKEMVITEPLKKGDLEMKMRVVIPNPWKPEEERFLPGVVYGQGDQFFMEVGESYGSLEFHEDEGWVCVALVPKIAVQAGLIQQGLENAKGSYTDRLLKRTAKKKKG